MFRARASAGLVAVGPPSVVLLAVLTLGASPANADAQPASGLRPRPRPRPGPLAPTRDSLLACDLGRNPFVLGGSAADVDGDGLGDDDELALAECFAPMLRFDARERHTGPEEPYAFFQVRPVGCGGRGSGERGVRARPEVVITYLMLWRCDGGFPSECNGVLCGDMPGLGLNVGGHQGDNQPIVLRVGALDASGRRWRVLSMAAQHARAAPGDPGWVFVPRTTGGGPPRESGGHLQVFVSAGKHHFFVAGDPVVRRSRRNDDAGLSCDGGSPPANGTRYGPGPFDWVCNEWASGNGRSVVPSLRGGVRDPALVRNVGEPERGRRLLRDLGAVLGPDFEGTSLFGRRGFCPPGGASCGAVALGRCGGPNRRKWSRDALPADADCDGLDDRRTGPLGFDSSETASPGEHWPGGRPRHPPEVTASRALASARGAGAALLVLSICAFASPRRRPR